jgi:hypothetical protein
VVVQLVLRALGVSTTLLSSLTPAPHAPPRLPLRPLAKCRQPAHPAPGAGGRLRTRCQKRAPEGQAAQAAARLTRTLRATRLLTALRLPPTFTLTGLARAVLTEVHTWRPAPRVVSLLAPAMLSSAPPWSPLCAHLQRARPLRLCAQCRTAVLLPRRVFTQPEAHALGTRPARPPACSRTARQFRRRTGLLQCVQVRAFGGPLLLREDDSHRAE